MIIIAIFLLISSQELDRLERWISELKEKEKHGSGEEDDDDELPIQVLPSPDDIYLRFPLDFKEFLLAKYFIKKLAFWLYLIDNYKLIIMYW